MKQKWIPQVGESHIYTNETGKELLLESERRKYIKIRKLKQL